MTVGEMYSPFGADAGGAQQDGRRHDGAEVAGTQARAR